MTDQWEALAGRVIVALEIPTESRVDQRVAKKLFLEHGAPTVADRKRIQSRIDEVSWLAALRPSNVAIREHRSSEREYLEISVLHVRIRDTDDDTRLVELLHRAIPYPIVLLSQGRDTFSLSLAHKRWSLGEEGRVVLDGEVAYAPLHLPLEGVEGDFVNSLALKRQHAADLWELYSGWLATVEALAAARVTGTYVVATTREKEGERREALVRYGTLSKEMAELRLAAERERQLSRRVEMNLKIKALENERTALMERL